MPNFTSNVNLYKWDVADTKQLTIEEMANNVNKIDSKFQEHSLQLEDFTKQHAIDVYKYGQVNTTDWADAIDAAVADAQNSGIQAIKFRKGTFNTSRPLPKTVHIFGAGRNETTVRYTGADIPFFLEIDTFHFSKRLVYDITLKLDDSAKSVGGVQINSTVSWGASCDFKNVNLFNFTGITLELINTGHCQFTECNFQGGLRSGSRVGTFVHFNGTGGLFSNMNTFHNCYVYDYKIAIHQEKGIQNSFYDSSFQRISLFLVNEKNPQIPYINFTSCWIEEIDIGIINAKTDLTTLQPVNPVTNKADLSSMRFFGNNGGTVGIPNPFLNATVEPLDYTNFNFNEGLKKNTYDKSVWSKKYTFSNGLANLNEVREIIQTFDLSTVIAPRGTRIPSIILFRFSAACLDGNTVGATYIASQLSTASFEHTPVTILGSIFDNGSYGQTYKLGLAWTTGLNVEAKANARGLQSITLEVSLLNSNA